MENSNGNGSCQPSIMNKNSSDANSDTLNSSISPNARRWAISIFDTQKDEKLRGDL
jgi:hypothetical protein